MQFVVLHSECNLNSTLGQCSSQCASERCCEWAMKHVQSTLRGVCVGGEASATPPMLHPGILLAGGGKIVLGGGGASKGVG